MVTVSRECVDSPLVRTETFGEMVLTQRLTDQYVDATDICRQTGKKLAHYLENKGTQEVMAALAGDIGIPTSQLVQVRRGNVRGDNTGVTQGTWLHPDLAIDFARWACHLRVTSWRTGRAPTRRGSLAAARSGGRGRAVRGCSA